MGEIGLDSPWPDAIYTSCCYVPSTCPLPTKDGGTLRTIRDACDYMHAALPATGARPAITHLKFRDGRNVIFDAAITMAFGSIAGGYVCVFST